MRPLTILLFLTIMSTSIAETIFPLNVETYLKGTNYPIPASLSNGTADSRDVDKWTISIRGGIPLERIDLNADKVPEIIAEIEHAKGVTGNRSFLLFVQQFPVNYNIFI